MRVRTCPEGLSSDSRGMMALIAAAVVVAASMTELRPAVADPPPAEEEAAVVVGEDETVVSEEGDSQASDGWNARQITLRNVGDKPAYIRQSSEAFEDPDKRTSLELKYYFVVPEPPATHAQGRRRPLAREGKGLPRTTLLATEGSVVSPDLKFPIAIDSEEPGRPFDIEWLDAEASPQSKLVAAVLPTSSTETASLVVARAARSDKGLEIEKQLASRELNATELPEGCLPGGLLDTWDRPKSLGGRAMFFGRVIAVLKLVEDRYAVDFYGESLNPESDCRVWLWQKEGALGRPVDIRFVQVPVKKGPELVGEVWALGVTCRKSDNTLHTIAFDYPLCRPAVMAQMQRALQQKPGGASGPPPDLEKLVGADLLDEFARRLVNGTYR